LGLGLAKKANSDIPSVPPLVFARGRMRTAKFGFNFRPQLPLSHSLMVSICPHSSPYVVQFAPHNSLRTVREFGAQKMAWGKLC